MVWSLAGLAVLAMMASPAASGAEVPAPLRGVKRIVCLGDSITQGGEAPGGYVWLARQYLKALYPEQGIEVLNAGISGHKSDDMLARFQKDVLDRRPDLVTISVGVNDVWHGFRGWNPERDYPQGDGPNGVPLSDYRRNVEEMVKQAVSAGAKVVVLSTTIIREDLDSPENAKLAGYNAALRDIARRYKAIFVDFQKPFHRLIRDYRRETGATDDLLTTDGVHMNGAGNRVMAHTLLSGLGVSQAARAAVETQVEQAQRNHR